MNIGKAIRIALINKDKTQVWLADELGTTKQMVNQLCNRESAQINLINDVADKLGMPTADLLALGE